MSQDRVVSEPRIAAASSGVAFWNALLPITGTLLGGVWPALRPILIILFGRHKGSGLSAVDGPPQLRSNTWIRLLGRSQAYTFRSLPRTMQCGWPPPVAPNVPAGHAWLLLRTPSITQVVPHWRL